MLAYRHQFHAGNFADVVKHGLLAQLAILLGTKAKPAFFLDTHAGIGRYDLRHPWALKNAEHETGIARLWERTDVPAEWSPYLAAVRAENPDGILRYYPGSPLIVRRLMRPSDRLVLTELNKQDYAALAALFARDRQVHVQFSDGYQALKAHLPPRERRGLALIDSSFDRAGEFRRLTQGLIAAHSKFATGVYALWYPLMEPVAMQSFERGIAATGIRSILQLELSVMAADWRVALRGCGLLVANPPYRFDSIARSMLEWVRPILSREGEGGIRARWLAPE